MPITHVGSDQKKLLAEIESTLNKAKRIVAITGAGISTECGIPDFRSKEGLYSLIKSEYSSNVVSKNPSIPPIKGKDLFSSTVWQNEDSASAFYKFIASLRRRINQDVGNTSQTHKLIRRMRDQKKLLRCYTQNIDGLEARDGLCLEMNRGRGVRSRFTKKCLDLPNAEHHKAPGGKLDGGCEVVQLHGQLETVRCTLCQKIKPWSGLEDAGFFGGEAPTCQDCELEDVVRQAAGKRRSAVGSLRPNIVLYGEGNPMEKEIGSILSHDLTFGADLLLIMGTSLKVHGIKTIVKEFAKAVHSKKTGKVIFINLSEPAKSTWNDVIDYWVEMDCSSWAKDKMKLRQAEIGYKAVEKLPTRLLDKENVPSTPASKRFSNNGALPTPPSTKKNKRVLAELDPVSVSPKNPAKKIRLSNMAPVVETVSTNLNTRRRRSSEFKIWEGEGDVVSTERSAEASIESSPSKGRKRKLL